VKDQEPSPASGCQPSSEGVAYGRAGLSPSEECDGAFYRRIRARCGGKMAVVATARKLAERVYRLLKYVSTCVVTQLECEEKYRQKVVKGVARRAKELGFTLVPVTEEPTAEETAVVEAAVPTVVETAVVEAAVPTVVEAVHGEPSRKEAEAGHEKAKRGGASHEEAGREEAGREEASREKATAGRSSREKASRSVASPCRVGNGIRELARRSALKNHNANSALTRSWRPGEGKLLPARYIHSDKRQSDRLPFLKNNPPAIQRDTSARNGERGFFGGSLCEWKCRGGCPKGGGAPARRD